MKILIENRESLICVKENIFCKISRFIKRILKKDSRKINNNYKEYKEINNSIKYNKKELMEIYNKAKKNRYDLNKLELDEIMMFINLIREEIDIKKEKLEQIKA